MPRPASDIVQCRAAHDRLFATIAGLDDDAMRRPSLLPEWSVGHLLTHIARNADSVVRRLDGARRNEIVDQYPGGYDGRRAEIAAGADRPAAALVDDVTVASRAVDAAFAEFPDDGWDRLARAVGGDETPVSQLAFGRWREVEVHHVDLGLGYELTDWPPELVQRWLPRLLHSLPTRTDPTQLMAWTIGRAPAPDVAPF
jgi:maleylpyruvate isomerase